MQRLISQVSRFARWPVFSSAPHRMMFLIGTVQMVAVLLYWGAVLLGRYSTLWQPPYTHVPAASAHQFLMLYGLFPPFFLGFLMTTYPRWMRGEPIPRRRYARSFLLLAAGLTLFYVGVFTSRALVGAGVLVYLAGWVAGLYALWSVFTAASTAKRFYERLLNTALAAGAAGMAAYALWVFDDRGDLLRLSRAVGLWWFLVPVVVTVAHRMIPFFSSVVIRRYDFYQPRPALVVMLSCSFVHGALAASGLLQWAWPTDLIFMLVALQHSRRWAFLGSFRVGILAMLHVAFSWCIVALALYTVQGLWMWYSGRTIMGFAPLHAIGIGFLTSMTVAMATRVTLGHSGRTPVADAFTWLCFWGVGLTALVRVAAAIVPAMRLAGVDLNVIAASLWLLFIGAWALRYAPVYLRRRRDGKPG